MTVTDAACIAEAMDYIIKETWRAGHFPRQCHARIRQVCEAVKAGTPLPFKPHNSTPSIDRIRDLIAENGRLADELETARDEPTGPALLPCPFCGGKAQIERLGDGRQSMIIACEDCGCRLESPDTAMVYEKHWAWNRRAPVDAAPSATEASRE